MRRERHGSSNRAARFLAPVVFLAAFTVAVLLVRSGLSGDGSTSPAPTTVVETRPATTTAPPPATTTTATPPGKKVVYEIEAGDTLETIAVEFDTTVEQLLTLNPDLDPVALRIGQKIRVK